MQVTKLFIYDFLEGRNKSFVIPVYQRDYSWKKENCQKLWDDLVTIQKSARSTHFLGSVVSIYDKQEEWMIIDGQQRLTTISLLLLSVVKYLEAKQNKTQEESDLEEDILNDYLVNKRERVKSQKIRLKPNKKDRIYFESLFDTRQNINEDSNMIVNYDFFYQKLYSQSLSPIEVFDAFQKLEIVNIELEREYDDPQLIFESLNSTGVDLSDGDLIRNFILMDLKPKQQEYLYNKYWLKIENLTGNIADFIRVFLIYKLQKSIRKSRRDTYIEFKKYSLTFDHIETELLLKELEKFAYFYSYIIGVNSHKNPLVSKRLERLRHIGFTVCYPFLMDVFQVREDNIINDAQVAHIIQIIESYAFRKIIVSNSTQSLNKLFETLAKEIRREEAWEKSYVDIFVLLLISKSGSPKFPTDNEFKQSLMYKEVYKLKAKNRSFLLESLENYNSPYKVDVDELTIEHIMPQKITEKWRMSLGEQYSEIHKVYLHTLGNLSLTAKNSKLSNKDFGLKKKVDFESSKLSLNYKLDEITSWNEKAILERSERLANEASSIWKYPETNYQKRIEEEKFYSLIEEEDFDFTGEKPKSIYVGEDKYTVKNWREVLKTTCESLFEYSPTEFKFVIFNSDLSRLFSENAEDQKLRSPLNFARSYYVEGNRSANDIVNLCQKLSVELNYRDEIIVELQ